jgi:hypothetical protein
MATLAGCATVVAGGPDHIPVLTNPPGAFVSVDGKVVGRTPIVVSLDRNHSAGEIKISSPGYQTVVISRDKHFNLWTLGNIVLLVLPVIVDLVTGDWQSFDEDEILLSLQPDPAAAPAVR